MIIEYQNVLEDVVYFNEYHFKHSPSMKKRMAFYRYGFPILFFIILIPALLINFSSNIFLWVIFSVIWVLIIPKFNKYSLKRQARKLINEGENKGILTKHTISLTDKAVVEDTEFGTTTTNWNSIEKVIRDDKYIFIYVNAMSAHIIPIQAFENEDSINEFYKKLESSINKNV